MLPEVTETDFRKGSQVSLQSSLLCFFLFNQQSFWWNSLCWLNYFSGSQSSANMRWWLLQTVFTILSSSFIAGWDCVLFTILFVQYRIGAKCIFVPYYYYVCTICYISIFVPYHLVFRMPYHYLCSLMVQCSYVVTGWYTVLLNYLFPWGSTYYLLLVQLYSGISCTPSISFYMTSKNFKRNLIILINN